MTGNCSVFSLPLFTSTSDCRLSKSSALARRVSPTLNSSGKLIITILDVSKTSWYFKQVELVLNVRHVELNQSKLQTQKTNMGGITVDIKNLPLYCVREMHWHLKTSEISLESSVSSYCKGQITRYNCSDSNTYLHYQHHKISFIRKGVQMGGKCTAKWVSSLLLKMVQFIQYFWRIKLATATSFPCTLTYDVSVHFVIFTNESLFVRVCHDVGSMSGIRISLLKREDENQNILNRSGLNNMNIFLHPRHSIWIFLEY